MIRFSLSQESIMLIRPMSVRFNLYEWSQDGISKEKGQDGINVKKEVLPRLWRLGKGSFPMTFYCVGYSDLCFEGYAFLFWLFKLCTWWMWSDVTFVIGSKEDSMENSAYNKVLVPVYSFELWEYLSRGNSS